jgi:hypothetical protein
MAIKTPMTLGYGYQAADTRRPHPEHMEDTTRTH